MVGLACKPASSAVRPCNAPGDSGGASGVAVIVASICFPSFLIILFIEHVQGFAHVAVKDLAQFGIFHKGLQCPFRTGDEFLRLAIDLVD
jgi:hypothetical protein